MNDDTVAVRAGDELDWPALEAYVRAHLDVPDVRMNVRQFSGGRANLTYQLCFGDVLLVLRRPPFGRLAPGAHDMSREYRVLSRLWQAYPRAPRALLFCDDERVIGAPFFVMEHRDGVVIRDGIPAEMAHHADVGRRASLALVDAMAELHLIDPGAAGLADLGRPDGFVARQLEGWQRRWELVAPPKPPPAMALVQAKLARELPAPIRDSVIHNDLKLDNCQFDPHDPDRVVSIFDWDMATVGDPLIDLGILLAYLYDDRGEPGAGACGVAIASRHELVGRYAAAMGIEIGQLDWYEAFACWKTAVVVQQLADRHASGDAHDDRLAALSAGVPVRLRLIG
jgi:aminoglycoside phosphotransferase (APT) family kinase protein